MNSDKFIWTSEEYTCSELREKFDNKFPVIALVTNGYYGENENHAIKAETILRIHDWGVQQRVVAKDHRGRFITIPTSYPLKIQQLHKTLEPIGKYITIQEFVNNYPLPKTAQLDKDEVDKLYTGDRIEMFGPLELIHSYAEKFFKATVFRGGSLAIENTHIIPLHIEMRFKVALGMKASSADDWTQWLQSVNQAADRVDFSSINGIPDIFVYKREAVGFDFNTEFPLYHVRHPRTLKKGMDRYSWNMCIPSPRRDGGWTKPSQTSHQNEGPKFNQTTGMKQPTMSPDVHSELLAKLGKSSKKQEMETKRGDFAERHKLLMAIFPGDGSGSGSGSNTPPDTKRGQEPIKREKRSSKETGPGRPMSGEYDTRLIPQEDNKVFGSHDLPKSRDTKQDEISRDPRERPKQSKIGDIGSYDIYNGRARSPRRGERQRGALDNQGNHGMDGRRLPRDYGLSGGDAYVGGRAMSPRRGERRRHDDILFMDPAMDNRRMLGDYIDAYPDRNNNEKSRLQYERYMAEVAGAGNRSGHPYRGAVEPLGRNERYRRDADLLRSPGPGGDPGYPVQSNREDIEALWWKRRFPAETFADITPEQLVECLKELNMEEHGQKFLDIGVNGLILMNLTKDDLKRDFGITGMQATRLMKFAREGWKT